MEALEAIFRWMHVFAGIIWIGHLYFFNWVNGPLQAKLDGPTKKIVVPELMPRALYWFRWGAAYTWITGLLLLMLVYYHGQLVFDAPDASWSAGAGIMIAVTFLAVFIYDALWKSALASNLRGAVIVSFVLAWTAIRAISVYSNIEAVRRPAIVMLSLLITQLCLGFTAFLTRVAWGRNAVQPEMPMVASTVAHVAVGALLLATTVVLAVQVWRHAPVAFAERAIQAQRNASAA